MVAQPLYLLAGKEEFLKNEFILDLKNSIFQAGQDASLNTQEFNASNDLAGSVIDFLQTAPFLSQKRLAIVREADEWEEDDLKLLAAYALQPSPTGVLVLCSNEGVSKKSAFGSEVTGRANVVSCQPPYERDLPGWILSRAQKTGKTIDRDALEPLVERVGKELRTLAMALEELALYIGKKDRIQAVDVTSFFGRSAEADVFELVDRLLVRDAKGSLRITEGLLRDGSGAYEIVSVLASQMEKLKKGRSLLGQGISSRDAALQMKVHPFYAEKFARQARSLGEEALGKIFKLLLTADQDIKKSRLPEHLAVERLILEICSDRPVTSTFSGR
ncbi:MAG TPA: DNA polymerase III subunit delta [Candidatus Omnitrophota bacterium]|nr:DNA polymerase III subunit delta [Candidatus Omnitrophota bacterium]